LQSRSHTATGARYKRSTSCTSRRGEPPKRTPTATPPYLQSLPKQKKPLTTAVSGCLEMGATGLEPVTPSVSSKGTSDATEANKGLTETTPAVCTPVCTSEGESQQRDTVEVLAAALLGLSPADRARLAALLLGQQEGK